MREMRIWQLEIMGVPMAKTGERNAKTGRMKKVIVL